MPAGKLDRRLRIEKATETRDPVTRETVRAWAYYATVWAERLPQTGREYWQAQQHIAEITAGWRVRWNALVAAVTPDESFRALDGAGREFDLVDVREDDRGRRAWLLLFGKARAE